MFDFGDEKRPSRRRLAIVLIGTSLAVWTAGWFVSTAIADVYDHFFRSSTTWFAPLVDVSAKPTVFFEDFEHPVLSNVLVGPVQADSISECTPSWGGKFDLDAASRALDLDRRLVRFKERGGTVVIQFGGVGSRALDVVCAHPERLAAAYAAVIDRYDAAIVDFHLAFGLDPGDEEALAERRLQAIGSLRQRFPEIRIWLTLPADETGLSEAGLDLLSRSLSADLRVNGVNLEIASPRADAPHGLDFPELVDAAVEASVLQWTQVEQARSRPPSKREIRARLGISFQIGRGAAASADITVEEAERLLERIKPAGLGRASFSSLNRDVPCGVNVDTRHALQTCSGVDQRRLEFSQLFTANLPAERKADPDEATRPRATQRLLSQAGDDPALTPYPTWLPQKSYEESDKTVWQGRVYQAKWWNRGEQPDAPVKNTWDSPWRYLGPVLRQDELTVLDRRSAGSDRLAWTEDGVFVAGDEIVHDDRVFRARWWTQGQQPDRNKDDAYDHPWEYRGSLQCEDGSCLSDGVGADLVVDFAGLTHVDVEIRADDGRTQSAGRLIQRHEAQSGRKTFSVLRDTYDLVLRVAAAELVIDSLDCTSGACDAGAISSMLSVDYGGLTGINLEIRHDDAMPGMTGRLVHAHVDQKGQKTYRVLRGVFDLAFTKESSPALTFDGIDCRSEVCSPGPLVATLHIDYRGLEDIQLELRRSDGVPGMAGDIISTSSGQSGQKTYKVLRGLYDAVFRMGTSEFILDGLDCRADTCAARNFSSVLSVDYGRLSDVHLEIREWDRKSATAGHLLRSHGGQSGLKTYHVLKSRYDLVFRKGAAESIVDSIDCTRTTCRTESISAELLVRLGPVPTVVEIRADDRHEGTSGALIESFDDQAGDKRYPVLRGRYDLSLRDTDWSFVGDSIDCRSGSCEFEGAVNERTQQKTERDEIRSLQLRLSELSSRYTEHHPAVIAIQARLDRLRAEP